MFDDLLRALKDRLMAPLARRLGPGVSPDLLTVIAFGIGIAAAVAAAEQRAGVALACWLTNRFLDGLDGTAARVHDRQTDFGGYLDILLDFIVYAAVPIGLVVGWPGPGVALAALVLMGTFFANAASWMYLSAVLEKRAAGAAARGERTTVTMPPAIIAGAETFVFFTLFLMLTHYLVTLFWTMAVLVGVNIVQRLVWAARHVASTPPDGRAP